MSGKSKLHQLGGRHASAAVSARRKRVAENCREKAEALRRFKGFGDAETQAIYHALLDAAEEVSPFALETGVDGEGERSGETSDGADPEEA